MRVQETVRKLRLQEWAVQIQKCQDSGLSVREWCEANKVGYKNYYRRRKVVQEYLLDSVDGNERFMLTNSSIKQSEIQAPIFASIPLPQRNDAAITVHIGAYVAEVNNGADPDTVENVLRALTRICY
jgi:hypothetical protein